MLEFIYAVGTFLFYLAFWVLAMTAMVGLSAMIVLLIRILWKLLTEEDKDE